MSNTTRPKMARFIFPHSLPLILGSQPHQKLPKFNTLTPSLSLSKNLGKPCEISQDHLRAPFFNNGDCGFLGNTEKASFF